jgi:aspartyl-tRNA synthetase
MARNLRLRHEVVKSIRDFMDRHAFIEVETPVLGAATPEGARDYLVPSRVHPGSFYALPQSPQQYKQLLMVAGVDRYFQIARCYRDEDLRADRQPEFTQLDIEMAFVEKDDILNLMEELYLALSHEVGPAFTVPFPFPRLTYVEAMERWGSDKPDLRYGMEITDLTEHVRGTEFQVFSGAIASGGRIRAIAVPGAGDLPRRDVDRLVDLAREHGAKGLVWAQFAGSGPLDALSEDDVKSPVNRFFTPDQLGELGRACGASRGDMLLIAADQDAVTSPVLDAMRREMAERMQLADEDFLAFCFVTDFPMFEPNDAGGWTFAHNPFAMPHVEDIDRLESDPATVLSHAYDIVCNGQEIGSGSIRIHDRSEQERILRLLKITDQDARERFGHMLEAFEYGAPPHGGIAPGIDRTVALLAQESDIREVIPFPKTKSASDPMTGAPSPAAEEALRTLNIAVTATEA